MEQLLERRLFHHVFAFIGTLCFSLICVLMYRYGYLDLDGYQTCLFIGIFWLGNIIFTALFFIPLNEKMKNESLVLYHILWGQLAMLVLGYFSSSMIEVSMMLSLATFVFVAFGLSSFTLFPAVMLVVTIFGLILFQQSSGRDRSEEQLIFWTYTSSALFVAAINAYVGNFHLFLTQQNQEISDKTAQLKKAHFELTSAKEEAEASSKSKTRFLAAASHDLRQPLHALELYIGALPIQHSDEKRQHIFCQMQKTAHELHELLNSLFDISRFDSAMAEVNITSICLRDILNDLDMEFRDLSEAENRPLTIRMSDSRVDTDPILLHQIIRGLVTNALKHAKKGRVLVGFRERGDELRCEVWDSGVGIDYAEQPRIFEEFYQVKNHSRNREQGLGLGLALINRMCEALDHRFGMRSVPGRGSVFWLTIKKSQESKVLSVKTDAVDVAPFSGATVLCVDDEPAILDSLYCLLTGWGYQVLNAVSCEDAIEKVAQSSQPPNLIICDYRLESEINGIDAISRIFAHFDMRIPALLLTGDLDPDLDAEASKQGYKLLKKPLSPSRLRLYILNSLKKHSALPSLEV